MSTNEARQLYQTGRRYAAFALLLGLLGLVSTALMWQGLYRMNLMSTLGIIGGVLYAGLGFRLIQTYRAKSFVKSLAKAASIQDQETWKREHDSLNRRFLRQWQAYGVYLCVLISAVLFVPVLFKTTQPYGFTSFLLATSLLFVGMGIWYTRLWLQARNIDSKSAEEKSAGG